MLGLCQRQSEFSSEQGRIHGYPSRVRVGRGSDEFEQPSSWAGAVTPKPTVNTKKIDMVFMSFNGIISLSKLRLFFQFASECKQAFKVELCFRAWVLQVY